MDLLRILLFTGLVLHKLLWEVLKRRSVLAKNMQESSEKISIRVIKFGKIFVLAFIMLQTLFLDILPISDQPTLLRFIGFSIFTVGLAIAIIGRLQLGDNWVDLEDSQVLPGQSLVSSGIYSYIRHPIYTGDLFLLLGLQLALNSWLALAILVLVPVVVIQAVREETVLSQALPGYSDYCRLTKRFIPFVL